jgi:hypothetical protein
MLRLAPRLSCPSDDVSGYSRIEEELPAIVPYTDAAELRSHTFHRQVNVVQNFSTHGERLHFAVVLQPLSDTRPVSEPPILPKTTG